MTTTVHRPHSFTGPRLTRHAVVIIAALAVLAVVLGLLLWALIPSSTATRTTAPTVPGAGIQRLGTAGQMCVPAPGTRFC